MNRIDRLAAILTHLQSKRLVKAEEIAKRFDISLRTVYRDIRALTEAGIPLIGEAGMGYSMMDGYRLPPIMFTKEEALALLMAEKIVQSVTDQYNGQQTASAMYKIRSVLRSHEKDILDNVGENISVKLPRHNLMENREHNILQKIMTAINAQTVVYIKYQTLRKEEITERNIEPVGIYYAYEHWYLIAYCQLREGYRTFRIDQIKNIEQTQSNYRQTHPSLQEYLLKIQRKEKLIKVVLQIDKSIVKYIQEEKYQQGFVMEMEKDDMVEMTFMVSGIYGIARWFMKMADHAVIIEPTYMIDHVVAIAEKMLERQKK